MPKFITVKVSKGGVGKTTVTTNLAHFLAISGKKVLIIDLDSQGNLSKTFVQEIDENKLTSSNLLGDDYYGIENYTYNVRENLDVICADIGLYEVSKYLESLNEYYKKLKNLVSHKDFQKYDFVFFDMSPGVADTITEVALCASDLLICPTHFDVDSLTGLILTINEISRLNQVGVVGNDINYLVVPNRFDLRFKKDNEAIFNLIYDNLEKEFIAEPIRENSHIKKARMFGKSAIEFENDESRKYEHKKANEDFEKLANKVIEITSK